MKHKHHTDCPFTAQEIQELQEVLYQTAMQGGVIPPHQTWIKAHQAINSRSVE